MSFELLVGPEGSGKTTALLERSLELSSAGKRVWWAGLPNQRGQFYRRSTERGALLGLEFQTMQQVYYRLLAHAHRLKPLVVGTGRLALVGEALAEEYGALPSPGEARLFSAAIAEAKRFGLSAGEIPRGDAEVERFRVVYRGYERLKGEAWDYDDFRREALRLAEAGEARVEADALFVDGLREIGPLDLRLLRALATSREVRLALPRPPPGVAPDRTLPLGPERKVSAYHAPNPVSESRWVLRALKRDLASGIDPLDLAVILPGTESSAFNALADEYGVPVVDERPLALADSLPGRLLLELLELPDYPTASRLLPIRELAPLARAALDLNVAGHQAMSRLAEPLRLGGNWEEWRGRLQLGDDPVAFAEELVALALAFAEDSSQSGPLAADAFRREALARAKEATRVATGPGFRAWWAALLREAGISREEPGGVALLDERLVSGRRYRRAYLMRAVEGSYGGSEREDYFIPEEGRVPLPRLFEDGGRQLPRRFEGRDRLLFAELRACAFELVVTFPQADQDGPLLPEPALVAGFEPQPLPTLPAGSRLELAEGKPFRAQPSGSEVAFASEQPSLEELRRYDECGMRYWLLRLLGQGEAEDCEAIEGDSGGRWWRRFVSELRQQPELSEERLAQLSRRYPPAAQWLADHASTLAGLRFGLTLPASGGPPHAYIDAAKRAGGEAAFYLFVAPDSVASSDEASEVLDGRWNELWAAGHMLGRYPGRIELVRVVLWPVLGEPVEAFPDGIRYPWKRISRREHLAREAFSRFATGTVSPSPGYQCRDCPVRDACREAPR